MINSTNYLDCKHNHPGLSSPPPSSDGIKHFWGLPIFFCSRTIQFFHSTSRCKWPATHLDKQGRNPPTIYSTVKDPAVMSISTIGENCGRRSGEESRKEPGKVVSFGYIASLHPLHKHFFSLAQGGSFHDSSCMDPF